MPGNLRSSHLGSRPRCPVPGAMDRDALAAAAKLIAEGQVLLLLTGMPWRFFLGKLWENPKRKALNMGLSENVVYP